MFSFPQILFALQFLLQQLKPNESGIVNLAIDVMVKILSLGKVGRVNCVLLCFVTVLFLLDCVVTSVVFYLQTELLIFIPWVVA